MRIGEKSAEFQSQRQTLQNRQSERLKTNMNTRSSSDRNQSQTQSPSRERQDFFESDQSVIVNLGRNGDLEGSRSELALAATTRVNQMRPRPLMRSSLASPPAARVGATTTKPKGVLDDLAKATSPGNSFSWWTKTAQMLTFCLWPLIWLLKIRKGSVRQAWREKVCLILSNEPLDRALHDHLCLHVCFRLSYFWIQTSPVPR